MYVVIVNIFSFFKFYVLVLTVLTNLSLVYSQPSTCFMVKSYKVPPFARTKIWCLLCRPTRSGISLCLVWRSQMCSVLRSVRSSVRSNFSSLLVWSQGLFPGQFLLFRLDLDYWGKHSPGQFMLKPMTRSKSEDFIKIYYVICTGQVLELNRCFQYLHYFLLNISISETVRTVQSPRLPSRIDWQLHQRSKRFESTFLVRNWDNLIVISRLSLQRDLSMF